MPGHPISPAGKRILPKCRVHPTECNHPTAWRSSTRQRHVARQNRPPQGEIPRFALKLRSSSVNRDISLHTRHIQIGLRCPTRPLLLDISSQLAQERSVSTPPRPEPFQKLHTFRNLLSKSSPREPATHALHGQLASSLLESQSLGRLDRQTFRPNQFPFLLLQRSDAPAPWQVA